MLRWASLGLATIMGCSPYRCLSFERERHAGEKMTLQDRSSLGTRLRGLVFESNNGVSLSLCRCSNQPQGIWRSPASGSPPPLYQLYRLHFITSVQKRCSSILQCYSILHENAVSWGMLDLYIRAV